MNDGNATKDSALSDPSGASRSPLELALEQLREKFDALLIAEVKAYGGIPYFGGRCGRETMELREAIAAAVAARAPQQPIVDIDVKLWIHEWCQRHGYPGGLAVIGVEGATELLRCAKAAARSPALPPDNVHEDLDPRVDGQSGLTASVPQPPIGDE